MRKPMDPAVAAHWIAWSYGTGLDWRRKEAEGLIMGLTAKQRGAVREHLERLRTASTEPEGWLGSARETVCRAAEQRRDWDRLDEAVQYTWKCA